MLLQHQALGWMIGELQESVNGLTNRRSLLLGISYVILIHFFSSMPWLCFGDFNEVLYSHEKLGGTLQDLSKMIAFRDVVEYCGFDDLWFIGQPFTWTNCKYLRKTWLRPRQPALEGIFSFRSCRSFSSVLIRSQSDLHLLELHPCLPLDWERSTRKTFSLK